MADMSLRPPGQGFWPSVWTAYIPVLLSALVGMVGWGLLSIAQLHDSMVELKATIPVQLTAIEWRLNRLEQQK